MAFRTLILRGKGQSQPDPPEVRRVAADNERQSSIQRLSQRSKPATHKRGLQMKEPDTLTKNRLVPGQSGRRESNPRVQLGKLALYH